MWQYYLSFSPHSIPYLFFLNLIVWASLFTTRNVIRCLPHWQNAFPLLFTPLLSAVLIWWIALSCGFHGSVFSSKFLTTPCVLPPTSLFVILPFKCKMLWSLVFCHLILSEPPTTTVLFITLCLIILWTSNMDMFGKHHSFSVARTLRRRLRRRTKRR